MAGSLAADGASDPGVSTNVRLGIGPVLRGAWTIARNDHAKKPAPSAMTMRAERP